MYFVWFVDPFESAERSVYEIHQIHEPGNRRHYPELNLPSKTPHEQLPQTCPFRVFRVVRGPLNSAESASTKYTKYTNPGTAPPQPGETPTLLPLIHEIYAIHGQTSGANAPQTAPPILPFRVSSG